MKKLVFTLAALLAATYSYTNSGGSPSGRSGSPASNGQTCTGSYCHSGGNATGNEIIEIKVLDNAVATDSIVVPFSGTIALEVQTSNSNKIGFSASVEDAAGNFVGTLTAGNTTKKVGNFMTHKSSSTAVGGDGVINWEWVWDAPANMPDSATIYVAVNFTNGNGTTSGDYVLTQTKTIYKTGTMNVGEDERVALNLYPNPAQDVLEVVHPKLSEVKLFDISGRFTAFSGAEQTTSGKVRMDVSELPRGTYLVHCVFNNGDVHYKHLVLE